MTTFEEKMRAASTCQDPGGERIYCRSTELEEFHGPYTEKQLQGWYRDGWLDSKVQFQFGDDGRIFTLATLRDINGNACPFAFALPPKQGFSLDVNRPRPQFVRSSTVDEADCRKVVQKALDNDHSYADGPKVVGSDCTRSQYKNESLPATKASTTVAATSRQPAIVPCSSSDSTTTSTNDDSSTPNLHPQIYAILGQGRDLPVSQRATMQEWASLRTAFSRCSTNTFTHCHIFPQQFGVVCSLCNVRIWSRKYVIEHALEVDHERRGSMQRTSREAVLFWTAVLNGVDPPPQPRDTVPPKAVSAVSARPSAPTTVTVPARMTSPAKAPQSPPGALHPMIAAMLEGNVVPVPQRATEDDWEELASVFKKCTAAMLNTQAFFHTQRSMVQCRHCTALPTHGHNFISHLTGGKHRTQAATKTSREAIRYWIAECEKTMAKYNRHVSPPRPSSSLVARRQRDEEFNLLERSANDTFLNPLLEDWKFPTILDGPPAHVPAPQVKSPTKRVRSHSTSSSSTMSSISLTPPEYLHPKVLAILDTKPVPRRQRAKPADWNELAEIFYVVDREKLNNGNFTNEESVRCNACCSSIAGAVALMFHILSEEHRSKADETTTRAAMRWWINECIAAIYRMGKNKIDEEE